MMGQPAAFMSYARFDDQHDDGQLTAFRERLAAEVLRAPVHRRRSGRMPVWAGTRDVRAVSG